MDGGAPSTQVPPIVTTPAYHVSQAAVYAEQKGSSGGWGYNNRLIQSGHHWLYDSRMIGGPQCTQCPGICPVPRSSSHPGSSSSAQVKTFATAHHVNSIIIVLQLPPSGSHSTARRQRPLSQPVQFGVTPNFFAGGEPKRIPMPEISEFSPQSTQYASSSSKQFLCLVSCLLF